MKAFVLAAVLVAAPAMAAEFVGARVEGIIGWDQQRYGDRFGLGEDNRNGSLGYGLALGYDLALGNGLVVAGLEGGVLFADRGLRHGTGDEGGLFRPRRDLEISARIGTSFADRAFLYGKIGYTNLELREEPISGVGSSGISRLDGLRLGAGIEVPITPGSYLKTEYRFSDYERGVKKNDILTGFGLRF